MNILRALARLLVQITAPRDRAEAMVGDLEEEYAGRHRAGGSARATWWLLRQALVSVGPNLRTRMQRAHRARNGSTEALGGRRGGGLASSLLQDVGSSLRTVVRRPLFSAVLVLTLAAGIGATTTVFSVVHGLVLSPFPFPQADRVVGVGNAFPRLGTGLEFFEALSPLEYLDVKENTSTLRDVVAWDMGHRQIDTEGPPRNVFTAFWWGDPLRTVGMRAYLGRSFTDEEVRTGAPVAMLSHRLWTNRFATDSSMVGGTISINGTPHTLVGIVPEGVLFFGTDLWTPMPADPLIFPRNRRQFQVMGRIRDGADLGAVNRELASVARNLEEAHAAEFEEYAGWRLEARPWAAASSGPVRTPALALLAAVGLVLLLVCANVANLLLGRAGRRRHEMAVRSALGAGRNRLLRQLLAESLLLSLAGGALGLVVASLGIRGFRGFLERTGVSMFVGDIALDGPVLAFAAAVAVGTGLLFGLVPALHAAGTGLRTHLQGEGRGGTSPASRQRIQRFFIGLETALALALLAGSGLLLNSLARLQAVDPGVDVDRVLTMRLTLPQERYAGSEEIRVFFQTLIDRTAALPGVEGAAVMNQVPPLTFSSSRVQVEGSVADSEGTLPTALTTVVTAGAFDALGVPLLAGRAFTTDDEAGSGPVAVVNQAAARRLFPDGDPIGWRFRLGEGGEGPWLRVVGVVEDARNRGLEREPDPEVFGLLAQVPAGNQLRLVLRTSGDPTRLLPAVRQIVQEMDPDQPIYAVQTLGQAFAGQAAPRRATTVVLGLFAAFSLLLAVSGVYAVVAYAVVERTPEIGIRMVLGAAPGQVRRMVVLQALVPVLVGASAGLGLALLLGRALEGILYGVEAGDPATLAAVTAVLVGAAAAASWIPARRASRLDPSRSLQSA